MCQAKESENKGQEINNLMHLRQKLKQAGKKVNTKEKKKNFNLTMKQLLSKCITLNFSGVRYFEPSVKTAKMVRETDGSRYLG